MLIPSLLECSARDLYYITLNYSYFDFICFVSLIRVLISAFAIAIRGDLWIIDNDLQGAVGMNELLPVK